MQSPFFCNWGVYTYSLYMLSFRLDYDKCEQSENSGFTEERALNLTYKRATIEDIDLLTETRIEVLQHPLER